MFWTETFPLLVTGLMSLTAAFAAEQKFTLVKRSITLTVPGHEDKEGLRKFTWTYGGQDIVDYNKKSGLVDYDQTFEDRAEFDKNTFSLRLNNLQLRDSGLFKAERHPDGKPTETVIEYELYVLEPVVAPTLTVVSKWSSSDSCNVTLKCTGLNVSLISSCNTTFCSPKSGDHGDQTLFISSNLTTVSCNHSNPVSWRQTTRDLSPLCPLTPGKLAPSVGVSPCLLKAILLSLVLVAMVTAVITVHIREKLSKAH